MPQQFLLPLHVVQSLLRSTMNFVALAIIKYLYSNRSNFTGVTIDELGASLLIPWIKVKPIIGLRAHVLSAAYNMSGDARYNRAEVKSTARPETMISFPKKAEKKLQCRDCLKQCKGLGYTVNKKSISAVNSQCELCGRITCTNHHLVQLCISQCFKNLTKES